MGKTLEYITKDQAREKLCSMCEWEGTSNCEECEHPIDDIPATDVAPVRHGRWKLEENWETGYGIYVHVCTACNAITPVNVSRYKYCPNCGAKMDGGEA
jgi:hypothetical protein